MILKAAKIPFVSVTWRIKIGIWKVSQRRWLKSSNDRLMKSVLGAPRLWSLQMSGLQKYNPMTFLSSLDALNRAGLSRTLRSFLNSTKFVPFFWHRGNGGWMWNLTSFRFRANWSMGETGGGRFFDAGLVWKNAVMGRSGILLMSWLFVEKLYFRSWIYKSQSTQCTYYSIRYEHMMNHN